MIKGSIHEEEIAILNVYESNTRAITYVKQKLIEWKGKIYIYTITAEDFTTLSQQRRDPGVKPAGQGELCAIDQ